MKNILKTLLMGTAFIVSAPIAHAQFVTSGDVISFGDSLTDNGNAAALTSQGLNVPLQFVNVNDFPAPSPRFLNPGGLTFVEQLLGGVVDPTGAPAVSPQNSPFQGTGVAGDVNLAVGGAFAGSGNLNAALGVGITEQIGAFALSGGTIDANDTVTYWAGANNFFVGLPSVTSASGAAALGQNIAGLAVTDIGTIASGATIAGGGPGQLVYLNLPNFAVLPSTNASAQAAGAGAAAQVAQAGGDAAAQAAANAETEAAVLGAAQFATLNYNTALEAGVAQIAAGDSDTVFVLLDVAGVFDEIIADPGAFGFTNTTVGCVFDTACLAADFDTQNQFLFSDGVHPTSAGQALVAELARQTLDPTIGAAQAAAIGDLTVATRQFSVDRIFDRTRSLFFFDAASRTRSVAAIGAGQYGTGNSTGGEIYGEVILGKITIGERASTPEADIDLSGFRVGADIIKTENLVFGIQASSIDGDGSQNLTNYESNGVAVDIYAAGKFNNAYAAASVGLGRTAIEDIERSVGVGPITNTGETGANQLNVLGELGYDYKIGEISLLPSVTVGYYRTSIDAFTEIGNFAPRAFDDRTIETVTGAVNLHAVKDFSYKDGLTGTVYAGVGYEDFLSYSSDDVAVGAVASTAAATAFEIEDPDGRGFLFDVGGKLNVTDAISIGADYRLGLGSNDTESHQGAVRVSYRY